MAVAIAYQFIDTGNKPTRVFRALDSTQLWKESSIFISPPYSPYFVVDRITGNDYVYSVGNAGGLELRTDGGLLINTYSAQDYCPFFMTSDKIWWFYRNRGSGGNLVGNCDLDLSNPFTTVPLSAGVIYDAAVTFDGAYVYFTTGSKLYKFNINNISAGNEIWSWTSGSNCYTVCCDLNGDAYVSSLLTCTGNYYCTRKVDGSTGLQVTPFGNLGTGYIIGGGLNCCSSPDRDKLYTPTWAATSAAATFGGIEFDPRRNSEYTTGGIFVGRTKGADVLGTPWRPFTYCTAIYNSSYLFAGSLYDGSIQDSGIRRYTISSDWPVSPGHQDQDWYIHEYNGTHQFAGDPTGYISYYIWYTPIEGGEIGAALDKQVDVLRNVTVTGTPPIGGYTYFQVQIARDSGFTDISYNGYSTDLYNHKVSPDNGTFYGTMENRLDRLKLYYVRVRWGNDGGESSWSSVLWFQTGEKGSAWYN